MHVGQVEQIRAASPRPGWFGRQYPAVASDRSMCERRPPMTLWLTELLADPAHGASVVTGQDGVDLRDPRPGEHLVESGCALALLEGSDT